jgi:hypothetical protein
VERTVLFEIKVRRTDISSANNLINAAPSALDDLVAESHGLTTVAIE